MNITRYDSSHIGVEMGARTIARVFTLISLRIIEEYLNKKDPELPGKVLHWGHTDSAQPPVAYPRHVSEATIKVELPGGDIIHEVAQGEGPVHALDIAIRKVLGPRCGAPVSSSSLSDYRVSKLPGSGTASKVRVEIDTTDGLITWTTTGIHESLQMASWHALVAGIVFPIVQKSTQPTA